MEEIKKRLCALEDRAKKEQERAADPKRRYALDWYVEESVDWLREHAVRLVKEEAKTRKRQARKIAVLAATSTAISTATAILMMLLLHKRQSPEQPHCLQRESRNLANLHPPMNE